MYRSPPFHVYSLLSSQPIGAILFKLHLILFISSFLIETKGIPYENQLFNGVEKDNLSTAQVATILWFASLNPYLLLCNIRKLKASFLISMPKYILEMTIDGFYLQMWIGVQFLENKRLF